MIPDAYQRDHATAFGIPSRPVTIVYYHPDSGHVLATDNITLEDANHGELPGYSGDEDWAAKVVPGHDATTPIIGWKGNKVDSPVPIFPGEVAWLLHGNEHFNQIALHRGPDMAALYAISDEDDGLNCSVSVADMEDETWATFENRLSAIFANLEMQEENQPSAG